MNIFNENTCFLNSSLNDEIHFFNISTIDNNLKKIIDEYIIRICYSPKYDININIVKKELLNGLEGIEDSNMFIGRISEFFIHLYLKYCGFEQQFIFNNLEDISSIKKGFDGYYILNNEEWIMESKSGYVTGNSHYKKIIESYNGLSKMFSGENKDKKLNPINPWRNAWNHANNVSSEEKILNKINRLSNKFMESSFTDISNYNIIPCSTIFLDDKSYIKLINDQEYVRDKVEQWLKGKKLKKVLILCITHETKEAFINYLKN